MRTERETANLRLLERVYTEVLDALDPAAVDALFDPGYIQHNPNVETGAQGLKEMLVRAKSKYPQVKHHVKRMLADGDLVAAHVHVVFRPGEEGFRVVDIFRIQNGRIAEHWDVMQAVASETKNDNGQF
jgi:predicted SnoaL-like aldol condensation-catalyzing enzyme